MASRRRADDRIERLGTGRAGVPGIPSRQDRPALPGPRRGRSPRRREGAVPGVTTPGGSYGSNHATGVPRRSARLPRSRVGGGGRRELRPGEVGLLAGQGRVGGPAPARGLPGQPFGGRDPRRGQPSLPRRAARDARAGRPVRAAGPHRGGRRRGTRPRGPRVSRHHRRRARRGRDRSSHRRCRRSTRRHEQPRHL